MIDASWLNHDEVELVTAIKRFLREQVAVNPLHTIVFGVANRQTAVQSTHIWAERFLKVMKYLHWEFYRLKTFSGFIFF